MKTYKAYSLKTTRVKEDDFPYTGVTLSAPEAVARFAMRLQDSDVEKFLVLYLDSSAHLICIKVWEGSISQAPVPVREVLKLGLLSGALSVIAVHNHPSGNTTPSGADETVTRALVNGCDAVGLNFLDHLIISGSCNEYRSVYTGKTGKF